MKKNEINIKDILKYILVSMLCISLIILAVGVAVSDKPLAFALGLLYGCAVSVVRILMLANTVNKAVDMEAARSKVYTMASYHLRMLLTVAAAVAGAMLREHISIIGMILGLLAMQPAVYVSDIIYKRLGGERLADISVEKADRHC